MTPSTQVQLRYAVRTPADEWAIPEAPVPEAVSHNLTASQLHSVLERWASRSERPLFVARNLAVRWLEERPSVGIDPDVCVLDPPPADVLSLRSLCLWKQGHVAPSVSFEIVSETHPYKDYGVVHERYAAFGARELVVFDPLLVGPKSFGGPVALQVWRRDDLGVFERRYSGPGPAFCETLGAWLIPEHRLLRLAGAREGHDRWLSGEEHERAEKERERAARIEAERRLAAFERGSGSSRE